MEKIVDFWCNNLNKITGTFVTALLAGIFGVVYWNDTHNQIMHDCNNQFYYVVNNAKCAAWRLHDGIVSGFLTPIVILSAVGIFACLASMFVRYLDEHDSQDNHAETSGLSQSLSPHAYHPRSDWTLIMFPLLIVCAVLTAITYFCDRKSQSTSVAMSFEPSISEFKEADLFKEIAQAWSTHSEHWFIKDYIVEPVGRWNWQELARGFAVAFEKMIRFYTKCIVHGVKVT